MKNLNINLPANFFDSEERCGYSISGDMKKVWAVLFDLLNEFKRACDKHDIRWWGDAGTILGAARHKGMIPWDDDIDVMLMREDYNRLCAIASDEFRHPYFFQTEETDRGSIRGHAQLRNSETTGMLIAEKERKFGFNQGIFLDIFPIDAIPDDDNLFQKQIKNVHYYRMKSFEFYNLTYNYHTVFRKNLYCVAKNYIKHLLAKGPMRNYFNYELPYLKFVAEGQKYKNTTSKRVCKMVLCPIKSRRVWQRDWFDETVYLPFEIFQLPVPVGYRELLDTFYGDWQTYKVGTSTHGGCFFDTDKPYTEYIK